MLEALRFIQGGIAKKDFTNQGLTHVRIGGGAVYAYNGQLSLQHPIDTTIEASPKGDSFLRAIRACSEEVTLSMTAGGKLTVKSGRYRAYVEQTVNSIQALMPEGNYYQVDPARFLKGLKQLRPFISEDASRRWSTGIKLDGIHMLATNNSIIVRKNLLTEIPFSIILPEDTVDELIRINEPVEWIQISEKRNKVAFHYQKDKWLCSLLFVGDWPDINRILDKQSNQKPVPDGFFQAINQLRTMSTGDDIIFEDGRIALCSGLNVNAEADFPVLAGPKFNLGYLLKLENVIHTIDFYAYPAGCLFTGDDLDGAIMGLR